MNWDTFRYVSRVLWDIAIPYVLLITGLGMAGMIFIR
jgi:hypothetical protein